jgi:purine-binding chemotaxis protein CheW
MSEARVSEQDSKTSELQKALAGKYLTFALAGEEYGLPVLRVREIIKVMDITVVPQVPAYVRGVELELPSGRTLCGVLVDAVSEVLNVTGDEVEATPTFGDQVDTTFMKGVAKVKGTVKILLDLDRVFEAEGTLPRLAA